MVDSKPFLSAFHRLIDLIDKLKVQEIVLSHIDIGGGLGICYKDEQPPTPQEYLSPLFRVRILYYEIKEAYNTKAYEALALSMILDNIKSLLKKPMANTFRINGLIY